MKSAQEPEERKWREWCAHYGFEFLGWDRYFCRYRDPRRAGTPLEHGLESWFGTNDEGAA